MNRLFFRLLALSMFSFLLLVFTHPISLVHASEPQVIAELREENLDNDKELENSREDVLGENASNTVVENDL